MQLLNIYLFDFPLRCSDLCVLIVWLCNSIGWVLKPVPAKGLVVIDKGGRAVGLGQQSGSVVILKILVVFAW